MGEEEIINSDCCAWIKKEASMDYFKVLLWHSPGRTEEVGKSTEI
jgi:hypothetical protein